VSDDPTNPIFPVTLTGTGVVCQLTASTNALNFGGVPVQSEATISVFVMNTSVVNCTITNISLSGSSDFILSPYVPTSRFTLGPGESVEIPISYLPSKTGAGSATLTMTGVGLAAPVSVALSGTGLRCSLTVTPVPLDFGGVVQGRTSSLALTLGNTGNTNCTIEGITLVGSGRFSVSDPAPPFVVGPGSNVVIEVEYSPVNAQTILILGGNVRSRGKPHVVTP
jgi:hypothetical protein